MPGCVAIGFYHAFAQYYRFSAANAVIDAEKGQAISTVLVGGILAAFLGPVFASFSQDFFPPFIFIGPFVLLGAILALNAVLFITAGDAAAPAAAGIDQPGRTNSQIMRDPNFIIACSLAVFSHIMMSYLMTATPIAVVGCGFEPNAAAQVVQWHLVAMYSPSLILKFIDIDRHLWRIVTLGCLFLTASVLMLLSGEQLINFNLGSGVLRLRVELRLYRGIDFAGDHAAAGRSIQGPDDQRAFHLGGIGLTAAGASGWVLGHDRLVSTGSHRVRADLRHGRPCGRLEPPPEILASPGVVTAYYLGRKSIVAGAPFPCMTM